MSVGHGLQELPLAWARPLAEERLVIGEGHEVVSVPVSRPNVGLVRAPDTVAVRAVLLDVSEEGVETVGARWVPSRTHRADGRLHRPVHIRERELGWTSPRAVQDVDRDRTTLSASHRDAPIGHRSGSTPAPSAAPLSVAERDAR